MIDIDVEAMSTPDEILRWYETVTAPDVERDYGIICALERRFKIITGRTIRQYGRRIERDETQFDHDQYAEEMSIGGKPFNPT
jgi:hypothetical protein